MENNAKWDLNLFSTHSNTPGYDQSLASSDPDTEPQLKLPKVSDLPYQAPLTFRLNEEDFGALSALIFQLVVDLVTLSISI